MTTDYVQTVINKCVRRYDGSMNSETLFVFGIVFAFACAIFTLLSVLYWGDIAYPAKTQIVDSTICKKLNETTTQCYHKTIRIKI